MTFPTTRLDITVEAALGPTDYPNPATWAWTDLSSRLLAQGIGISRGSENESQGLQPSTATLELDNLDGALTPNNAMSAYWPYIRRGTPVRITTEGGRKGAWLPGGLGNYWSSAHRSADNISGDIDIRLRIDPDRWSDSTPSNIFQYLVGIWGDATANTAQWILGLNGPGQLSLQWSTDGAFLGGASIFLRSLAALRPVWIGVTLDANNGSGGHTARLYRYDSDSPPADITTWTLVETSTGAGTVTMATGASSPIRIGTLHAGVEATRGKVYNVQVRNGINGTVVANADFTAQALGATSFNDSTGRTWTRSGTATISTSHTRFMGSIDSVVLSWPYGNHNAAVQADHPSECRAIITISDVVRRLGQGAQPLQSSLRRFITGQWVVYDILGYWPCEDADGAARLASGLPNGISASAWGLKGTDGTLISSAPLQVIPADGGGWRGVVASSVNDSWAVDLIYRADEGPGDPPHMGLISVRSGGDVVRWDLSLTSAGFHLYAYDIGGTQVVTSDQAFDTNWYGPWMLMHMEVRQDGGDIDWSVNFLDLETARGASYTGTVGGATNGMPTEVYNTLWPGDAPKGLAFGHVTVTNGNRAHGWLAGADTAWVGESAAHRIWRLANEEGLVAEIVGDPDLDGYLRGKLDWSQPLGPQAQDSLVNLLDACAAVDRGVLTTREAHPGFVYRTRDTLDNQPVRLVLDASTNAVRIPLEPTLDDQRIRNDVTVSAQAGASARVVDTASVTAEGRYQEGVNVAGVGGVDIQDAILIVQPGLDLAVGYQNEQLAGWLVALGTQTDLRYPKILVDFSLAPSLMTAWTELNLGDRIQLTGLPNQHPSTAVELIVEYKGDLLAPTAWVGELVGSPGAPYLTGVLDA